MATRERRAEALRKVSRQIGMNLTDVGCNDHVSEEKPPTTNVRAPLIMVKSKTL